MYWSNIASVASAMRTCFCGSPVMEPWELYLGQGRSVSSGDASSQLSKKLHPHEAQPSCMKFLHDPPENGSTGKVQHSTGQQRANTFTMSQTACKNSRCVEGVEGKCLDFEKGPGRTLGRPYIPLQISEYDAGISATGRAAS
jgi:hypothetical protein